MSVELCARALPSMHPPSPAAAGATSRPGLCGHTSIARPGRIRVARALSAAVLIFGGLISPASVAAQPQGAFTSINGAYSAGWFGPECSSVSYLHEPGAAGFSIANDSHSIAGFGATETSRARANLRSATVSGYVQAADSTCTVYPTPNNPLVKNVQASGATTSEFYETYRVSSATLPVGTPVSVTLPWRINGAFSAPVPGHRGEAALRIFVTGRNLVFLERFFTSGQGAQVSESGTLTVPTEVGLSFTLNLRLSVHVGNNDELATQPWFAAGFAAAAVALSTNPAVAVTGVVHISGFSSEVLWTNLMGATADWSALTKTAAAGWNTGATSKQALVQGDGWVEFTTMEATTHKMAGLSHGNTYTDFADIDFGILLSANGTFYVFEGGVYRGLFGVYSAGDRFGVAVENGIVQYWHNGVLFYTSGNAPAYPLLVDTALYSPGATLTDVVMSGDLGEAVTWAALVQATAFGSTLTKAGVAGWNAGAISTRAIGSGDGFVSFSTNEATTHKMIGLSQGNTNTDFADIDFAILLASNGTSYVFESGTFRGVFGAYAAGDQFEVAVEGGVVTYLRNGAVFYTSGLAPVYPLLVDTALYTPGATLIDVVLGCVVCQ